MKSGGVEWSGVKWSGVDWNGVAWRGVAWKEAVQGKEIPGREGLRTLACTRTNSFLQLHAYARAPLHTCTHVRTR